MKYGKRYKRYKKYSKNSKFDAKVKKVVTKAIMAHEETKWYSGSVAALKSIWLNNVGGTLGMTSIWGELAPMSSITGGTTIGARIANQVRLKSIDLVGVLTSGDQMDDFDNDNVVVRFVCALWNGTGSDTPLADLNVNMDANITPQLLPSSGSGQRLIKKYADWYIPLNNQTGMQAPTNVTTITTSHSPIMRPFHFHHNFGKKGLLITYTTASAQAPDKQVMLAFKSNVVSGTGKNTPGFVNGRIAIEYCE